MRKLFFNFSFTFGFIATFAIAIYLLSGTLVNAIMPGNKLFPADEQLNLAACQQWTDSVRSFNIESEQGANDVTVLMYHRIMDYTHISGDMHMEEDGDLHNTIVLKSEFKKQMNYLKQQGYITLTAAEFQLFMDNKLEIPKKSILITFDDGFKNNYEEAYPILKENGFTAINFIITGHISEKQQKYDPQAIQYFSESDIKKSCDVFDFQSHTYDFHQRNDNDIAYLISKEENSIYDDMKISYHQLNKKTKLMSYPYGEYDSETISAIKRLDTSMAFTVEYANSNPSNKIYEIPRKAVFPDDSLDDFIDKLPKED